MDAIKFYIARSGECYEALEHSGDLDKRAPFSVHYEGDKLSFYRIHLGLSLQGVSDPKMEPKDAAFRAIRIIQDHLRKLGVMERKHDANA